jgi:hypothetical protein
MQAVKSSESGNDRLQTLTRLARSVLQRFSLKRNAVAGCLKQAAGSQRGPSETAARWERSHPTEELIHSAKSALRAIDQTNAGLVDA